MSQLHYPGPWEERETNSLINSPPFSVPTREMDPPKLIPFKELIQIASHLTNPLTNNPPETQAINLSEKSTVNFDQQFFLNRNLKQNWKRKAREKKEDLLQLHRGN